jgi:aspartate oxidase
LRQTDFLVIGSGIAGLSFALKVAAHGTVILVTKKQNTESNTNYAQGDNRSRAFQSQSRPVNGQGRTAPH